MNRDNIKQALRSRKAKYAYAFLGGFILASMAAPSSAEPRVETREVVKEVPKVQTVTKTEYRTPQSCKDALSIDNQIFVKVGQALGTFQFDEANAFMASVKDERTAKYGQCIAS